MLNKKLHWEYALFYAALSYMILALVFQFMIPYSDGGIASDFFYHVNKAVEFVSAGKISFLNLFQDMVAITIMLFHCSAKFSAMLVTLTLEIGYVIALHYWLCKKIPPSSSGEFKFLYLLIMVLGANLTYFPQFRFYQYGVSGLNTWHNPTSYAVKPFVVTSFFLFVQMLDYAEKDKPLRQVSFMRRTYDGFNLTGIFLAISLYFMVYGKISGLAAWGPVVIVYTIIWWIKSSFSKERFNQCLVIAAAFVPAGIQSIIHFIYYFPVDGSGRSIVFSGFTNITIDLLAKQLWAISFSLFIIVLRRKTVIHNKYIVISFFTYIVAFIERYMFDIVLANGSISQSGDNGWAAHYARIILLLSCLIEFSYYLKETYEGDNQAENNIKLDKKVLRKQLSGRINFSKGKPIICYIGSAWASLYLVSGLTYILLIFLRRAYGF